MTLITQKYRLNVLPVSFPDLIEQSNFSWVDGRATDEHFPFSSRPNGERNLLIVHFGQYIESDEALSLFKENKLSSAEVEDLLTFTAAFLAFEFPLALLGSRWYDWKDHRSYVLYPRQTCCGRHLGLAPYDYPWPPICRFIAVPQNAP